MISTEWVHTAATGIPVYAAAGLVLWGQGYVWRRTLWIEHGPALLRLAARLDGAVAPTWTGWRIRGRRGELRVRGGLRGLRVVWQADGQTGESQALGDAERALGVEGAG